jgi:hypothetical protein
VNPTLARVIVVACDVTANVAAGLAQTVCAAASTLAVAVLAEASAAHDPGHEPSGPPWVPAVPSPMPPPQSDVLDRLAAVGGSGWFDRLEEPPFSPWLSQDWRAPDDLSDMDGADDPDGPVSP